MNAKPYQKAICTGIIAALLLALLTPSWAFAQEKSPKKAALLSIILPGTGEWYAGGHKSSRFFFFTEGLFWTGLFAFKKLNSARENAFKSYAAAHAGASVEGKPASYFDRLVSANSIYDYNDRLVYVEGDLATPLPETPDNFWEWDSPVSRDTFHGLRSKATWARTRSFLFVGALIFNRFASALNAAHIAAQTQVTPLPNGGAQAQLQVRF